jgi:hypothetical protein
MSPWHHLQRTSGMIQRRYSNNEQALITCTCPNPLKTEGILRKFQKVI